MSDKPDMQGPLPLSSWPRAFAAIGQKINEVCEWFRGIKAGPGITVTKSKGATIIALNKQALSTATGDAVEVVGSDGALNAVVKHSTWSSPGVTDFPTHLQTGPSNGDRTYMDGGTEMGVTDTAFSEYVAITKNTIVMHGTNDLEILESALSHDMGIVEWDVCNSGAPGKALFISSAPYAP